MCAFRAIHSLRVASCLTVLIWGSRDADAWQVRATTHPNLSSSTSVAGAKYRLSQGGFDMSLDAGGGAVPFSNFIQKDLGSNSALSNKAFDFSLRYIAGQGFVFTMSAPGMIRTLAWGSGADLPADGGNTRAVAAMANGRTPPTSFNALQLIATSTRNPSYMAFEDLVFTSDGNQAGALTRNGRVGIGAVGTPPAGVPSLGASSYQQWLIADTNLARQNWTLSGKLVGARDAASSSDDAVRFTIDVLSVVSVPEPSTLAIAGLGGLGFLAHALLRRR